MHKINSFDIFDTLLARRCVEAKNIFQELEDFSGIKNIARIRCEAELLISKNEYTIDDIYIQIAQITQLNPKEIEDLKSLEISLELENAIPIASNISKVNDGDILISDMYLHKKTISSLLRKINIDKEIGLFVSSHGKSHLKVWNPLQKKIHIDMHRGDNLHSDVNSPNNFGIKASLSTNFELNGHEKFFRDNGLEQIARITRELRLAKTNSSDGLFKNRIKLNQFQNNFPLLILSAAYTYFFAKEKNINKVLFCSRDCHFMNTIFGYIFYKGDIESIYFYTSRIARTRSSQDYIGYCNQHIDDSSLIVDLCGTGWSLGNLYSNLGIQPNTLLIHEVNNNNIIKNYDSIKKFYRPINLTSIINSTELDNSALELCNYTTHGMVVDVKSVQEINYFHPIFELPNYSPPALNIVKLIQQCEVESMTILQNHSMEKLRIELERNLEKIPSMINELYKDIVKNKPHYEDLLDYHSSQDEETMRTLAK